MSAATDPAVALYVAAMRFLRLKSIKATHIESLDTALQAAGLNGRASALLTSVLISARDNHMEMDAEYIGRKIDLVLEAISRTSPSSIILNNHQGAPTMTHEHNETHGDLSPAGTNARVHDVAFLKQTWNGLGGDRRIGELADDITKTLSAMKPYAGDDHYAEMGALVEAKKSAEAGDGAGAMGKLKAVGQWTLDFATKVGASVLAEAIKQMVLPKSPS